MTFTAAQRGASYTTNGDIARDPTRAPILAAASAGQSVVVGRGVVEGRGVVGGLDVRKEATRHQ